MPKLITLLLALLMIAVNAFAAVNVNSANEKELQSLTGIGPTKARAIIDYRTKNGEFKAVDDLAKVPGIGPAVLSKIKSDVTLTGPTTPKAAAEAGTTTKASAAPAGEGAKPATTTGPAAAAPSSSPAARPASSVAAPAVPAAPPAAKADPAKK